jgi:tRNA/rRNA methyltransferase
MSGLTTQEVSKCQIIVRIPTDSEYSSLNLASAVQVMAYELRMAVLESGAASATAALDATAPVPGVLARFNEIELLLQHLEHVAIRSGFLDPEEPKRLMQRLRRLFARARLEKEEVNILRGILSACEKRMQARQAFASNGSDAFEEIPDSSSIHRPPSTLG